MKFLSDMGISPKTMVFLRNLGYEAVHLHEQGLNRLPDSEILKKAVLEGYIILTHDLDFGELVAGCSQCSQVTKCDYFSTTKHAS